MATPEPGEFTRLLAAQRAGNADLDAVLPVIYEELRRLAGAALARERSGHTLSPTALVHEAYLGLSRQKPDGWQNRAHFFAIAATLIRRILVDHARERNAAKRGGGARRVTLCAVPAGGPEEQELDVLELHRALEELADLDPRQAQLVELRFFGGLTMDEAARELGVAKRTAEADWTMARSWLQQRLGGGPG